MNEIESTNPEIQVYLDEIIYNDGIELKLDSKKIVSLTKILNEIIVRLNQIEDSK